MSRFPAPSRWTFFGESVMVSISPVPKMCWPVSYFQFAMLGASQAGPEKESCQTVCQAVPVSGAAIDLDGRVMPVMARTIHSSAASVFHRCGHRRLGRPGRDLTARTTFPSPAGCGGYPGPAPAAGSQTPESGTRWRLSLRSAARRTHVSGILSPPPGIPGGPPDRFRGATVPGDPGQTRQIRSGLDARRRRRKDW